MPKNDKREPKKNACSLSLGSRSSLNAEEAAFFEQFERKTGSNSRERGFRRAQKRVFELLCSNIDLNIFVTLTVNFAREDYNTVIRHLSQWLDNQVRRKGLRYILVPEYHDDERSIHFHGVMNGESLKLVNSGHRRGRKAIYNICDWSGGFATGVRIGGKDVDWQRTARYIADYMLKDTYGRVGGRFYLHGGLLREPIREYFFTDYQTASGEEITVDGKVSFKLKRFL